MRCIECGHELKEGAVFCIRCGAMQGSKGDGSTANQTVKPATSSNQFSTGRHNGRNFSPTPRKSKASVIGPVVGVVAALAAVAALAVFVINPGASSPSASSVASVAASSASTSTSSASASSSTSSASSSASSASASSKSASAASTTSRSATSATTTGANGTNGTNAESGNANAGTNNDAGANGNAATNNNAGAQQNYVAPEPEPTYATDDSYYMGDTSTRYYSLDEVESMSNYDLFYARNEIFARHGRMFNDPELQAYFNSKSWYTPIYSPEEFDSMASPLNDIEEQNSTLMLNVEQARGSAYI